MPERNPENATSSESLRAQSQALTEQINVAKSRGKDISNVPGLGLGAGTVFELSLPHGDSRKRSRYYSLSKLRPRLVDCNG
jgi:hypothetical protein